MIRKPVISGMLAFIILIGTVIGGFNFMAVAENIQLTAEQRNELVKSFL